MSIPDNLRAQILGFQSHYISEIESFAEACGMTPYEKEGSKNGPLAKWENAYFGLYVYEGEAIFNLDGKFHIYSELLEEIKSVNEAMQLSSAYLPEIEDPKEALELYKGAKIARMNFEAFHGTMDEAMHLAVEQVECEIIFQDLGKNCFLAKKWGYYVLYHSYGRFVLPEAFNYEWNTRMIALVEGNKKHH